MIDDTLTLEKLAVLEFTIPAIEDRTLMQEIPEKDGADNTLVIRQALELAQTMGLEVSRIWFQEPVAPGDRGSW